MYTWLSEKVAQAQQILKVGEIELGFKFNSPARQDEIQRCEETLGFILPNSYKEFLKFSNGANIFCSDQPRFEITQTTPSRVYPNEHWNSSPTCYGSPGGHKAECSRCS